MKKFIRKLILFIGLLAVSAYAINHIMMRGLRTIDVDDFGRWNKIVDGKIDADILISGSSRALYHFDPRIIEAETKCKAYNVGLDGAQFDLQLALLELFIKHNRKPRVVIQEVSIGSLLPSPVLFKPAQYVPYLNDRDLLESLCKQDWKFYLYRYLPLYGLFANELFLPAFQSLMGMRAPETLIQGFSPREEGWNEDFDKFKAKYKEKGKTYAISGQSIDRLKEIIHLCEKNRMDIVLVYPFEYFESQLLTANRKEIFRIFKEIAAAKDIEFWDFSDNELCKHKRYFYNSQHLNKNGATLFSQIFSQKLRHYLEGKNKNRDPMVLNPPESGRSL